MFHGKKGFDRIVYAFKNVLTKPVTWLFTDLRAQGMYYVQVAIITTDRTLEISSDPFKKHFPVVVSCLPDILPQIDVEVPRLQPPEGHRDMYEDDFSDFSVEIYEWLSVISLESPRVVPNDRIDPFLSRYSPPPAESPKPSVTELVKISWKGFTSSSWAHKIFVQALLVAKPGVWFSFATLGFDEGIRTGGRDCTILKLPGAQNEYMLWEVEQG
jgi:ribonuclease P/MRP protein subunit RPP40